MRYVLAVAGLIGTLLIVSCGAEGSGTCTCTCVISGAGTTVNNLTGEYTESECESAASLVENGGTNECGNFSDGSVVCSSSWIAN